MTLEKERHYPGNYLNNSGRIYSTFFNTPKENLKKVDKYSKDIF